MAQWGGFSTILLSVEHSPTVGAAGSIGTKWQRICPTGSLDGCDGDGVVRRKVASHVTSGFSENSLFINGLCCPKPIDAEQERSRSLNIRTERCGLITQVVGSNPAPATKYQVPPGTCKARPVRALSFLGLRRRGLCRRSRGAPVEPSWDVRRPRHELVRLGLAMSLPACARVHAVIDSPTERRSDPRIVSVGRSRISRESGAAARPESSHIFSRRAHFESPGPTASLAVRHGAMATGAVACRKSRPMAASATSQTTWMAGFLRGCRTTTPSGMVAGEVVATRGADSTDGRWRPATCPARRRRTPNPSITPSASRRAGTAGGRPCHECQPISPMPDICRQPLG